MIYLTFLIQDKLRFIRDDYNDQSPDIFCYNVFDYYSNNKDKEMFLLYDLNQKKIVENYDFLDYDRNELEPIALFKTLFTCLCSFVCNIYSLQST